jgi:hypothetical protein
LWPWNAFIHGRNVSGTIQKALGNCIPLGESVNAEDFCRAGAISTNPACATLGGEEHFAAG